MMHKGSGRGGTSLVLLAALAVAVGAAVRILLVLKGRINSDEAIVGLMGMEILKGHHFVFYWGQGYMGSLEAYVAAFFFLLWGVSSAALKAVPAVFFLAAVVFHYLFVRRVVDRQAALLTVVLLFLPSWVFTVWTVAPRGGYMEIIALGGAVLYLSAVMSGRSRKGDGGWFFLLGLLSGVGFWTLYLFVCYLIPLGATLLLPALFSEGRWKRLGSFAAGFLLGASPVICYNILHPWSSLEMLGMAGAVAHKANLFNLAVRQLPQLLGANKLTGSGPLWPPLGWALLGLFALASVHYPWAVWRRHRRSGKVLSVALMPTLTVVTGLALFLGTGFGAFNTHRYLLPLYPLFAVFLAVLLRSLMERWRFAAVLTAFVLAVQGYGTWFYLAKTHLPDSARFNREAQEALSYCRDNGIRTAYSGHWICYVLTFLSREELVVADIDRDRYEPFQRLVAASPTPSLIIEGYGREMGKTLTAIGYRFGRGKAGRFNIFAKPRLSPEIGPTAGREEVRMMRTGGGEFTRTASGGLVSDAEQKPGMSLVLELDSPGNVNGVIFSPGENRSFYPRSFTVETSPDGTTWEEAASVDTYLGGVYHFDRLRYRKNGWVSIYFRPRKATRIRITLVQGAGGRRWAVEQAWVSKG